MLRSLYVFSLETILAALLLYPYLADQYWQERIFLLIGLLLIIYFLYTCLLLRFKEKGKLLFLILIIPGALWIGANAGLHPFFSLAACLFIFWRGMALLDDPVEDREMKLFSASMLASVPAVIFSAIEGSAFLITTVLLLAVQFILAMVGRFFRNLYSANGNILQKKGYIFFYLMHVGLLLAIGAVFALALDVIQRFFFFALGVAVRSFGYLAMPFLTWVENKHFNRESQKSDLVVETETGFNQSEVGEGAPNLIFTEVILGFLLFAAIGIGFYFLFKKKFFLSAASPLQTRELTVEADKVGLSGKKRRSIPPVNEIRKEFYDLERYAEKSGLGRLSFESLGEWLNRIEAPVNNRTISLYERVRYGKGKFTPDDLDSVKSGVKDIRNYIRSEKKRKHR